MGSYLYSMRVGHFIFYPKNWAGHVLFCKEGHEGGVLILFPVNCFFLIPAQIPHSQPVWLKFKSHSHFLLFLFHESQSQCTKSHFPASKKGKSQLPFYPFTTLCKRMRLGHIKLVFIKMNFSCSPHTPPHFMITQRSEKTQKSGGSDMLQL